MARTRGGGNGRRRARLQDGATRPTTAPVTAEQLPLVDQAANLLRSDSASVAAWIARYWRPRGRVRQALKQRAWEQRAHEPGKTVEQVKLEALMAAFWESDHSDERPLSAATRKRVARVIAGDPLTDELVARFVIAPAERDLLAERPRLPILLLAGERHRAQHVPLPEETLPARWSQISCQGRRRRSCQRRRRRSCQRDCTHRPTP